MKNILLACGAGASSGFIAQKMRKAAQSRGLEVGIRAISDTEIMENIDGVGVPAVLKSKNQNRRFSLCGKRPAPTFIVSDNRLIMISPATDKPITSKKP